MKESPLAASRWREAWPDALGFAAGLALAWHFQWATRDLIWSLWLSSLVVGYAMIVVSLFGPAVLLAREGRAGAATGALVGAVFLLAFFTFHFGLFHFVHSAFLQGFFPLGGGKGFPNGEVYRTVLQDYWWFVPVALLAERRAFRLVPLPPEPPPRSVRADDIAQRKARNARLGLGEGVMAPYQNVIRLHLLIFFFAAAHFARLDHFLVYAVVYAAYFFPWRLLRRGEPVSPP